MVQEEASLRGAYQQWSLERLVRAATVEKGDYRPEAVDIMLEELMQRGVPAGKLPELAAQLPPPVLSREKNTRFFPARLNRQQYVVRWMIFALAVFGGAGALAVAAVFMPSLGPAVYFWGATAGVYKILGLDIPRLKNAGISPWVLLLFFLPLVNIGLLVLLFVAPPKK